MTTPNYDVNCEECKEMATTACLHCVVVFCDDCTREHLENNHNAKMLIKQNGVAYLRENTKRTSKLENKHTTSDGNVKPPNTRGRKTKRRKHLSN
jgi:hypothetical protein